MGARVIRADDLDVGERLELFAQVGGKLALALLELGATVLKDVIDGDAGGLLTSSSNVFIQEQ